MTTSRSRTADANVGGADTSRDVVDETPRLNAYEIHSGRTVVVDPDDTDGWIATDLTVEPRA
jgi:hypothetical protein